MSNVTMRLKNEREKETLFGEVTLLCLSTSGLVIQLAVQLYMGISITTSKLPVHGNEVMYIFCTMPQGSPHNFMILQAHEYMD